MNIFDRYKRVYAPDGGLAGAAAAAAGGPAVAGGPAAATGGANGSGAAAVATGTSGGDPAGGQSGADGGHPSAYRPDGLPDHLYGKDDRDTVDKLFKAFDGYRRTEAERGRVPDSPDGYKFTPDEAVKPFAANLDNDEFFKGVRGDAHEAGVTDKGFNTFVNKVMKRLVDAGAMEKPVDFAAELQQLVPDDAKTLDEPGQKAAVSRRIQANIAWLDGAKAQGAIPTDVADELMRRHADTAIGQRTIEWLRAQGSKLTPALGGSGGGAAVSEAEVDARIADPRNDSQNIKFDPGYREQTDRLIRRLEEQKAAGRA